MADVSVAVAFLTLSHACRATGCVWSVPAFSNQAFVALACPVKLGVHRRGISDARGLIATSLPTQLSRHGFEQCSTFVPGLVHEHIAAVHEHIERDEAHGTCARSSPTVSSDSSCILKGLKWLRLVAWRIARISRRGRHSRLTPENAAATSGNASVTRSSPRANICHLLSCPRTVTWTCARTPSSFSSVRRSRNRAVISLSRIGVAEHEGEGPAGNDVRLRESLFTREHRDLGEIPTSPCARRTSASLAWNAPAIASRTMPGAAPMREPPECALSRNFASSALERDNAAVMERSATHATSQSAGHRPWSRRPRRAAASRGSSQGTSQRRRGHRAPRRLDDGCIVGLASRAASAPPRAANPHRASTGPRARHARPCVARHEVPMSASPLR